MPLAAAPALELAVAVELCSATLATPSISRMRLIVSATTFCEVAQPETVKIGTLPAGVADVTAPPVLPAAPPVLPVPPEGGVEEVEVPEPEELDVDELDELVLEELLLDEDGLLGVLVEPGLLEPVPTAPLIEEIEASGGSTRANS